MVRIEGIDLRRFEFDLDLTWYVFFLNADGTIYGRFGGRDASDAEARISTRGLRFAMDAALQTHRSPPPVQALAGSPVLAEDYQAAKQHRGCIHCHNVNEFRRADLKTAGKWDRQSVWVYPLPENIGVTLDVDVGNQVTRVTPGSAAAQAGIKPADRLTRIGGHPVASFGDAIFALHKAPWKGKLPISWTRGAKEFTADITLAEGWRKTNLTWRPSMLDLLPSVPFSGEDLTAGEKQELGVRVTRAVFRQDPQVHPSLRAVGVEGGDIVLGVDGQEISGSYDTLLGHVRKNYLVGDELTINIIRRGKRIDLKLVLK